MANIKLTNIQKSFDNNQVIKNLNLDIRDKEFLVLLGPSGCGKTTTLRAIAGLEDIDAGEISIDGRPVHRLHARDRDIAFVFQLYSLYPHMSVFENIAFPLKATREPKALVEQRVRQVAKVVCIEPLLYAMPSSLSGGDMQRVALARALVRRPKALLMDEPIGSLDAKLREQMRTELKRMHLETRATTLYVTHDQVEAMSMADRIAILNDGVLQQVGSPSQVYEHPANAFVAQFVGSPTMNVLNCRAQVVEGRMGVFLAGLEKPMMFSLPRPARLERALADATRVEVGIRPEAVHLEKGSVKGLTQARVEVVEPTGPFDIVDVRAGDNIIRVKTPAGFVHGPGGRVWFGFDESRMHFFDRQNGRALTQ